MTHTLGCWQPLVSGSSAVPAARRADIRYKMLVGLRSCQQFTQSFRLVLTQTPQLLKFDMYTGCIHTMPCTTFVGCVVTRPACDLLQDVHHDTLAACDVGAVIAYKVYAS